MVFRNSLLVGAFAALALSLAGTSARAADGGTDAGVGGPCTTDSQCTDVHYPICRPQLLGGDGHCHPCGTSTLQTGGAECLVRNPATPYCGDPGTPTAGQCVTCVSDTKCQTPGITCNLSTGLCAACLGNGDCGGNSPICNVGNGQCIPCNGDYEPNNPGLFSCSNPAFPACQPAGDAGAAGKGGDCTQCSATNPGVCPGDPNHPKCITKTGDCGCTQDSDCPGNGRICDTTGNGGDGVCVNGCREGQGNNDCQPGYTCVAADGGVGTCQGAPCDPSHGNGDCSPPTPICVGGGDGGKGQCEQCAQDSDCSNGKVCETDPNNPNHGICVDCTPSKPQNCQQNGPGNRCLGSSDTCGCIDDGDCGDPQSGRVCGPNNTCENGCRGQGGNMCPTGQACSSTTHDIGTCGPGDGGAGDGGDGGLGDGGNAADPFFGNTVEGGGCSCSAAGTGAGTGVSLALGLGLAVTALARRRKK